VTHNSFSSPFFPSPSLPNVEMAVQKKGWQAAACALLFFREFFSFFFLRGMADRLGTTWWCRPFPSFFLAFFFFFLSFHLLSAARGEDTNDMRDSPLIFSTFFFLSAARGSRCFQDREIFFFFAFFFSFLFPLSSSPAPEAKQRAALCIFFYLLFFLFPPSFPSRPAD